MSSLYETKIGPVDDIQAMQPTPTNNEMIMMKAKQDASKIVGTRFGILNVMRDLGQVFEKFDKEGQ